MVDRLAVATQGFITLGLAIEGLTVTFDDTPTLTGVLDTAPDAALTGVVTTAAQAAITGVVSDPGVVGTVQDADTLTGTTE